MRERTVWTMNALQTPGTTYRCENIAVSPATHSFSSSPTVSCGPFPSGPSAIPAGKELGPAALGRREFMSWLILLSSIQSVGFCQIVALSARHKLKTLEQIVIMRNE